VEAQTKFIFLLLILFQIKQFIADFPLQKEYMLRKVLPGWDFVPPLALHCAVHAVGTLLILSFVAIHLWWLAVIDFAVHFMVDRIKSSPRVLGRYRDQTRPAFWNVLGLDQMMHHFTHYWIIWYIAVHR
jgi:hypothetical protein